MPLASQWIPMLLNGFTTGLGKKRGFESPLLAGRLMGEAGKQQDLNNTSEQNLSGRTGKPAWLGCLSELANVNLIAVTNGYSNHSSTWGCLICKHQVNRCTLALGLLRKGKGQSKAQVPEEHQLTLSYSCWPSQRACAWQ